MQFVSKILIFYGLVVISAEASYPPGTVLEIQLPNIIIERFRYEPTREGYVYSYKLPNGERQEEVGILLNAGSSQDDLNTANDYSRNDRPTRRPGVKNRKLSPKSLQSLAG